MTLFGDLPAKRAMMEAVETGVAIVVVSLAEDGKILYATRAAEMLFGYLVEGELSAGCSVDILVPEALQALHVQHRAAYAANPEPRAMGSTKVRLEGRHRDGSTFPVEITLYPKMVDDVRAVVATIITMASRLG